MKSYALLTAYFADVPKHNLQFFTHITIDFVCEIQHPARKPAYLAGSNKRLLFVFRFNFVVALNCGQKTRDI
ncbi:hypothetical protein OUZ56_018925 [Daphnia magna]|uniref:Uncharacterized protein n=1 Tax=Daphnia magna TaxID=35525 RepID=A0ABQ9ZA62_9CRUS|nr:hypothetical protein OUZ56_018925 [Daphnia magna]